MVELHAKVRRAYVWTFTGSLIQQALSFSLSMMLARFLRPADYGLVGMVGVFIAFLTAMQDLGIGRAVIYFEEAETAWSTCCTISAASGLLLSLIMFASAPLIASFYAAPDLIPIVHWLSLTLFLGGLRSPSQSLITKQLLFQKITVIEGLCALGSAAVAVYLAWRGFGAWSIVFNLLFSSILKTVIVLHVAPPAFTMYPDLALTRRFLRWGMPLTGSTLCWSFYDNADEMIVGKLVNSEQLGFYSVAFRLATLVNERIGALISRVSFPAFAAMQNDPGEIIRHWLSVTRKSALISFPLLAVLALEAEDLVSIILGPKWLPVVPPLRLLCVVGAVRVLTPVVLNLLPALGRSDVAFRYTIINVVVMSASFVVGCRVAGIAGVGWAWVIMFPASGFWLIGKARALTGLSWHAYLQNLLLPTAGTIAATVAMVPFRSTLSGGMPRLACSVSAGLIVYGLCCAIFYKRGSVEGRRQPKLCCQVYLTDESADQETREHASV